MNSELPAERRVELVLAEMTRAEKLSLLFGYFGKDAPWAGYTPPPEARAASAGYVPGIPRLGIPAQWQTDAGIGVATQGGAHPKRARTALPSGLGIAATWSPRLAEAGGAMIGAEARSSGFNVLLAGGVNLLRDAHCGRNFEYGGEDPLLAGTIVAASIRGIQSQHVISTVKHFAINDQETDRKGGNSILADAAARMSDLLAFELAIEGGRPGSVMCAYNKVGGIYSCENPYLLTDVLRRDWLFDGFVMSDWGAVHSAAPSVNAGLDQQSGWPLDDQAYFQEPLVAALEGGAVTQARLDDMVRRILGAMFRAGLFERPVAEGDVDLAAHAPVTLAAANAAIVLLKNESSVLPLASTPSRIAVIGGHADKGVLSGGGSAQVYPPGENAVPGIEPTSWPGPVVYFPSAPLRELEKQLPSAQAAFADGTDLAAAVALAKRSDVAIVFATQWTTESIDTALVLPGGQDLLINAVANANPRTIVVLETGGPVLMPWASKVPAIVMAWYPGSEGGRAIAEVLTGKVNPSGHLPLTLPQSAEQLAHPNLPRPGDVQYFEGAAVGYKWFDKQGAEPLFPFGHGLSYSTFSVSDLVAKVDGLGLDVSLTWKNTGAVRGRDVAQVYAIGAGWESDKRLVGYQEVELGPGEQTTVHLKIDPRLLATFRTEARSWEILAGDIEVFAGTSSLDRAVSTHVSHPGGTFEASAPHSARRHSAQP